MGRSCPWSSSRSPTRRSCPSASGATTSRPRSATTRWSCWPARPARARPRSCPRSVSSSVVARRIGGKMIGHTQPRRIAARSVAERIAEELGTELGDLVGYQVRFTDRTSKRSRVKLMTDGILLAELQRDRDLRRYDTIIIDEAHERSLNIDFLLGYLKRLLPRRPDLKVIITSATIDVDRFAEHFDAPVVEVSGRTYPVEVRYRPLVELPEADEEGEPIVRDQTEAIVDAVRELSAEGPGDILVFLPGEREIRDTADALADTPRTEIVPLYSRLSAAEQHKVFARAHRTPRRARHQRRRDVADRPGHPVRRRHRRRADQPLLGAHQGAAAADRGDQPGVGQPALRTLRPARAGHRDPALLRGGLRGPPGVHRSGDPADQPGQRHPADGLARAGRHGAVPVRRAAGPAQRLGRRTAAGGARRAGRHGWAGSADQDRPAAGPAADRPAAGADGARGGAARLRPRGDRDRRGAVAAGPARTARRAQGPGRPAARAVQGRRAATSSPGSTSGATSRSSSRSCPPRRSGGCASASSSTGCGSASGRTSSPSCARSARRWRSRSGRPADVPDADGIHQSLLAGLL